jgi:molybdopterin/thiamine biosynthesis adenylyltransferase
MTPQLEADLLAASQPLRLPGGGERRVLSPVAVDRLSQALSLPRWRVEALALDLEIAPLHYLRNLERFGAPGQLQLLRSAVAFIGYGPAIERALELVGLDGIGTVSILIPAVAPDDPDALSRAEHLAGILKNRNASCTVKMGVIGLKAGNPAASIQGADVVAACLSSSMDEQLLQFACRVSKIPLVLGAVQETRGQATTVFPGEAGTALVYKPSHPHLDSERAGCTIDAKAALMVGSWLSQQTTNILLDSGDTLRGRLLYADLNTAEISEYTLG